MRYNVSSHAYGCRPAGAVKTARCAHKTHSQSVELLRTYKTTQEVQHFSQRAKSMVTLLKGNASAPRKTSITHRGLGSLLCSLSPLCLSISVSPLLPPPPKFPFPAPHTVADLQTSAHYCQIHTPRGLNSRALAYIVNICLLGDVAVRRHDLHALGSKPVYCSAGHITSIFNTFVLFLLCLGFKFLKHAR
jgi:hypothetical protein